VLQQLGAGALPAGAGRPSILFEASWGYANIVSNSVTGSSSIGAVGGANPGWAVTAFALHNATEGFGIVGPLAGASVRAN
jgi:hypothetical protein